MDNPLLDKLVKAVVENAYQDRSFDDSCSITGDDFQVCIFCGSSNLEAAKRNVTVAIEHKPDCPYLDALAYQNRGPDA